MSILFYCCFVFIHFNIMFYCDYALRYRLCLRSMFKLFNEHILGLNYLINMKDICGRYKQLIGSNNFKCP